ncbi:trichohyalin [Drosophila obscura]|uniref:trichohyalin n=1 Tax=Drosophila obscura TaxID=7282 RepID=UPI001BB22752|nr:trichohyalin [Drosophila obscura]
MHYFIWTTIVALLALASAANVARLRSEDDQTRTEPRANSQQRRYQQQDTARAFYSYGYSDDTAARAEYSSRDGSSRGFYSYLDADGKLQTVRYEASRGQGFRAEGSNLPQAPVDEGKPPLPVADTVEVQQARSAHLNALREAREEALAASLREESERRQQDSRTRASLANEAEERSLSNEDADILERVRAQLTAMLADRQRSNNLPKINEEQEEQLQRQEQRQENQDKRQDEQRPAEEDQRQGGDRETDRGDQARLRTIYSLGDLTSSSYLKLGDPQERLNGGDLRVPVGAYYTLLSPSAKYSVTTPTELRTLRPVALSRSLLVSKRN